jgi:hypothetical protein
MHGIKNLPFVNAAPFIDISTLKSLELEICLGIAKSKIHLGVYGPGVDNEEKYKSLVGMLLEYSRSDDLEKQKLFKILKLMSIDECAIFFKLYEGMYSASTVVYIRDFIEAKTLTSYQRKADAEATYLTENGKYFPKLLEWIKQLPFDEVGRVLFFIHEHDCQLLLHRDGPRYKPHKNEFLWLNPCEKKQLYVYDEDTKEKHYINTPAAFFNDLDMHGGNSCATMTWSLRIDGKFNQKFKEQLGIDKLDTY